MPQEILLGRDHRVRGALVLGQVAHQAQDHGHVGDCGSSEPRHAQVSTARRASCQAASPSSRGLR